VFGWVRQHVREHGIFTAMRVTGQVAASKATATIANKCLPPRVMCPCCGWSGRRFHDYIEVGYKVAKSLCPQCESHARHRNLFLWMSREFDLATKRGTALIFAPERAVANLWLNAPHLNVCRIDITTNRDVDLVAKIESLPIGSASIDLIWCHHVLEHVENDRAAIKELARILRPGEGVLLVSVPMILGTRTDEYGYPDPNQSGHWRMYGDDFEERLADAGLSVQAIDVNLSAEERRRYAVEPERFYLCRRNPL
jgi:SAM-dependent methyltransferase